MGASLPFAHFGRAYACNRKAALDGGAQGLVLPMIESAAQLRQAVSWPHYPPRGNRGVGYSRANLFGKTFDLYRNGFDPFLVAQIEHRDAAREIDAILEVPGVDAIMI